MNSSWLQSLLDSGAELQGDRVLHFGNADLERRVALTGNVFCDLSHDGLIRLHGADSADFLQAQLANDISGVTADASQTACYLSPKGRVLAVLRVFRHDQAFYLCLPRDLLATITARLRKYVLRAQVTVEDASDAFIRIGLSGPTAEAELESLLGVIPMRPDQVVAAGETVTIRLPGAIPRFQILGTLERMRWLWERLNVRCAPVGPSPWQLLQILSGVPSIREETMDRFLPQMLNLDRIGAISFSKGCYPGQEVVNRVRTQGAVKRHLRQCRLATEEIPPPATQLLAGTEPAGEIIEAAPHPDSGCLALAVIRDDCEGITLRLAHPDGPVVRI